MQQAQPAAPAMEFPVPKARMKNRFLSIDLQGKKLSELSPQEFDRLVARKIWSNGIVCVKNQDLNPAEMKQVAAIMGKPLELPPAFSFENRDPANPEVVHIGNIRTDGKLVSNVKAAEYWHHDGNFWGIPGNQIVNILHAKIIPPVGGTTGFMDSSLGLRTYLDNVTVNRLKKSTTLVSCRWISDFKNANPEDMLPDVTLPCVQTHPMTGEECLYLPFTPDGLLDQSNGENWISNDGIWDKLVSAGFTYQHQYEAGDVLLWDNLQVMHRSMGGYGDNPRLLYRAQSQYSSTTSRL